MSVPMRDERHGAGPSPGRARRLYTLSRFLRIADERRTTMRPPMMAMNVSRSITG
jgi:hypothetical protein